MKLLCLILSVVLFACATKAWLPPCTSRLRTIRPWLFTHCECRYSKWTNWELVSDSIGDDLSGNCESGKAYQETRRQYSIGAQNCHKVETRSVCVPKLSERLAALLGLGRKPADDLLSVKRRPVGHLTRDISECQEKPVCHDETTQATNIQITNTIQTANNTQTANSTLSARGKRHLFEELPHPENDNVKHYHSVPFSIQEHGHRLRRDVSKCDPGDNKHVLFVLDTSGSIGQTDFKKMKNATAELTALFCDDIKVAVLTFNDEFHLEFDFDCFDNSDSGRREACSAINAIKYRGGQTHTGGATQCICEKLLKPAYGVEYADATCVEVIYITDGASNDPDLEICNEVECLHDHNLKVNTYSIGIGNQNNQAYQAELSCIQDSTDEMSLFWFKSFDEFSRTIQEIISRIRLYGEQCWGTEIPTSST